MSYCFFGTKALPIYHYFANFQSSQIFSHSQHKIAKLEKNFLDFFYRVLSHFVLFIVVKFTMLSPVVKTIISSTFNTQFQGKAAFKKNWK